MTDFIKWRLGYFYHRNLGILVGVSFLDFAYRLPEKSYMKGE